MLVPRHQLTGQLVWIVSPRSLLVYHIRCDAVVPDTRFAQSDLDEVPVRRWADAVIIVGQDKGKKPRAGMPLDGGDVIRHAEPISLTWLRGHVAHVHLERVAGANGALNVVNQEIGHHTGKETARPGDNQISLKKNAQSRRIRWHTGGLKIHPLDGLACPGNCALAYHTLKT